MENNIDLDEAASKGYDKKLQSFLTDKIYDLLNNIEQGKVSEFILASGNIVSLKCETIKDTTYVFTVVKDDSKAFKKWEVLSIEIKSGNGDNPSVDYKKNSKIITTQDNGQTFDLIFNASKKSGLKDKFKINKIKEVKLTTEQPNEEQPNEEQPNEEQPNEEQPNEEPTNNDAKLKKEGEEALNYMLNDPILQKAFYEQPSLWNLFVAELTGKKAKGKGIITVSGLVKKYSAKKSNELKELFFENKNIVFSPLEKITVVKADDNKIYLEKGNKYNGVVMNHELGFFPRIKCKVENIDFVIEIKSEMLKNQDSFNINIIDDGNHVQSSGKIQIDTKKSNGYKPKINQTKEEKPLAKTPTKK